MSPAAQAIAPPRLLVGQQGGVIGLASACHQSGAAACRTPSSEMPKNAWKPSVISNSTSRKGYAGRFGPGSIPTSAQTNR